MSDEIKQCDFDHMCPHFAGIVECAERSERRLENCEAALSASRGTTSGLVGANIRLSDKLKKTVSTLALTKAFLDEHLDALRGLREIGTLYAEVEINLAKARGEP